MMQEFWLYKRSINQQVLPSKDNAYSIDSGLRVYKMGPTLITLQIRKSTDNQKRLISVNLNREQVLALSKYLTEVAETLEDE